MKSCVHDRTYWIANRHMCVRCHQIIEEKKVTHLSSSYIAHKLVTLEAQLARYEVIGSVEQIRAVIKEAKFSRQFIDFGEAKFHLSAALDDLDGGDND